MTSARAKLCVHGVAIALSFWQSCDVGNMQREQQGCEKAQIKRCDFVLEYNVQVARI